MHGEKFEKDVRKLGDGGFEDILDRGDRDGKSQRRRKRRRNPYGQLGRARRSPTNSARLNRALVELTASEFKVHMLLWKWRGAPARGKLPFFTIKGVGRFCNLTRPTVRCAIAGLVRKGWIQRLGYNAQDKNELYRLVAIVDVPRLDDPSRKCVD